MRDTHSTVAAKPKIAFCAVAAALLYGEALGKLKLVMYQIALRHIPNLNKWTINHLAMDVQHRRGAGGGIVGELLCLAGLR